MSTARYLIPCGSQMVYTNPAPLALLTSADVLCGFLGKQPGAKRQNLSLEQPRGILKMRRWQQSEGALHSEAGSQHSYLSWANLN